MTPVENFRHFKPAGPVASAFLRDHGSLVKMLRGPVGGGKSVTTVYDGIRRPSLMPACNDGIIRYRRAIVGITYGQLERNLYPTWWRWLPKDPKSWTDGEWEGGGGRFARQRIFWQTPRKGRDGQWRMHDIQAEYLFAAIGELAVEEFFRGFEPTDILVIEADQAPATVIPFGITRLGRYPATGSLPDALPQDADWTPQLSGDLNSPDTDSWYYEMAEEAPPPGFRQYVQPGGTSPRAENVTNLPKDYYQRQIAMLSTRRGGKNLIKRMVHNQYAPSPLGEPVYADLYDDEWFLAPEPLPPMPRVPLVLGFDQGLGMPAAILFQRAPGTGQFRILDECVPGRMNSARFAEKVRLMIEETAPDVPLAEVHYCDPAGFMGADKEAGELFWAERVAADLGIVIVPTDTNEIDPRLTAVSDELIVEGGQPRMLISPRCRMLRKGFVSHYMFEKRPDEKSQNVKPIKNKWSNPHDALQYGLLGVKGRYGVMNGKQRGERAARASASSCTIIRAPVELG